MPAGGIHGIQSVEDLDPDEWNDADHLRDLLLKAQENYRDLYLDRQDQVRLAKENSQLKHANNVLLQKLGTRCRCDFARLPPEILLMVFHYALPPRWLLSGSVSLAPHPQQLSSVDLRMKLSILSVCKSWHHVGTELLYKSITLRRIAQLPVFVRALEGRAGLGHLVKHLDLDCFVPRGYSTLLQSETSRIFGLCPNLSHLGLTPAFWITNLPCSLPAMNPSITSLQFGEDIPYSVILPCLVQVRQRLKYLALTAPNRPDDSPHPVLDFDKLEDLRLNVHGWNPQGNSKSVLASKWRMPNLRRFWLYGRDHPTKTEGVINAWLDAYGRRLAFLQIESGINRIQGMLDRCPVLEHLVLEYPPGPMTHPTIKFLDVLRIDWVAEFNYLDLLKAGLPSFRGCRTLHILASPFWDLPVQIPHPEGDQQDEKVQGAMGEDADAEEVVWPSVLLEFTDPCSVNGWAVDRIDLSDDYVFNSEEDDGGSVNGSESDGSDSDLNASNSGDDSGSGSHETGLEDWEVDHDEALEIFYRTREII